MKYLIVGLGRSGRAAKNLLLKSGVPENLIATFDDSDKSANYSDSTLALSEFKPGTLVVSPGYPLSKPWIQSAKQAGIQLTSEISLAVPFLKDEKIVGVTGSLGKSTTVALLGEGALAFDPHCFVGGNFGVPLCEYAINTLSDKPRARWLIIELSSFQLENCSGLRLDCGVITYFAPNHLERYADLNEYYETKWSLVGLSKGAVFTNKASAELESFVLKKSSPKVTLVSKSDSALSVFDLKKSHLIGEHNQDNLALAASVANLFGWPQISYEKMKSFGGLAHRLENLGLKNGVRYINDSKATAIESVSTAIHSCLASTNAEQKKLFVLLGGQDKKLPWAKLQNLKNETQLNCIFFGECAAHAKKLTTLDGPLFSKLGEAIQYAEKAASHGDTVLLSPGGTSRDEFKNFEERGLFFKKSLFTREE